MKNVVTAILFAALAAPVCAQVQDYPAKPVRLISGFAPGGGSDIMARLVADKLRETWGRPFVVDNRPGAGGTIAMTIASGAAPDGYTLLVISGSALINAVYISKLRVDVLRVFAPVAQLASGPYLFVVHPSVKARSIRELIDLAKANPGRLNYGSSGIGSSAHLGGELFKHLSGTDMVHVPFKGSGAMMVDLVGGHIQIGIASAISSMAHVRAGRLRALAVTSGKRSPSLPDLPTVAEAGVPGYSIDSWYGIVAPASTAAGIVSKLSGEIARSLHTPAVVALLAKEGAVPVGSAPSEFHAVMREEVDKWGKFIKASNIQLN